MAVQGKRWAAVRIKPLTVRTSQEERRLIERAARQGRETLSDFMRRAILAAARMELDK